MPSDLSAKPLTDDNVMAQLAYAFGPPAASATIRTWPEDFQVQENLGFEPEGDGQHVWLRIRKRNLNTQDVVHRLAQFAEVKPKHISFSGLKDRNALTTQWFSIDMGSREGPEWLTLAGDDLQVVAVTRHRKKLRRGVHKSNAFRILLRDLEGAKDALVGRLETIARDGVPNYFGAQRFGRNGANVARARALFNGELKVKDRHKRSLYLSAARALLFNKVLSRRVEAGNWNTALPGDVLMLDGTQSIFCAETIDEEIKLRVARRDLHPTGPLWGRGASACGSDVRALEASALSGFEAWQSGLEKQGLTQARRALRVHADGLRWNFPADDMLELCFTLPAGAYATAVLREVVAFPAS